MQPWGRVPVDGGGVIIGNLMAWKEREFKTKSRQLDLLARGEFSPIEDELRRAYPNTDLPVKAIPFVPRYLDELSGHYAFPVVREFEGLPAASQARIAALYGTSRIDVALAAAEDALWTQNVAIILPMPDGLGRVRLQLIQPWQIDTIETSDAMRADDIRTWTRLVAWVPASNVLNQVVLGRLELTPTTATREIGGSAVGIYNKDGTHRFGRIPLVVVYRRPPDTGHPLPPVNEAVLNLQIALSLRDADDELIVRNCAYPQKWIRNATINQMVEALVHGPDKFLAMVRSGDPNAPAPELAIAQGQVPVAELVSFAEHQIRLYCSMLGIDPTVFMRVNTAVTAAARLFSMQDRQAQRSKIEPRLAELEGETLRIVDETISIAEPALVPGGAAVKVGPTWRTISPSPDQQSEAQAQKARIDLDLESRSEIVARERGVSLREARKIVEANATERAELAKLNAPPPPPPPPPGVGKQDGEHPGAKGADETQNEGDTKDAA